MIKRRPRAVGFKERAPSGTLVWDWVTEGEVTEELDEVVDEVEFEEVVEDSVLTLYESKRDR